MAVALGGRVYMIVCMWVSMWSGDGGRAGLLGGVGRGLGVGRSDTCVNEKEKWGGRGGG